MAISHKHYNRHTAYLLRNSDLPGFSQQEQEQLAVLATAHRGKLSEELFADIAKEDRERLAQLVTIMRLAAVFKYVEQLEELPDFTISAAEGSISMDLPEGWLDQHPLTAWELTQQVSQLAKIGISLSYK
jgi:exopolyphosphatase/guanosine-5'-triphosphate,3'-diphosphate pyrophosphatase